MRILRGLSARVLPCGCLVGLYETYEGPVVRLIDARDPACPDPSHTIGREVAEAPIEKPRYRPA